MKQMTDVMKTACEGKLNLNEMALENFKITVAELEAPTEMLMKHECKKEIEREKYQNSI